MDTLLSWSGGKDSMMSLHRLVQENRPPRGLLTTFSGEHRRITMHGVRESLLDAQAEALGFPVQKIFLPADADMKTYNHAMHAAYELALAEGATKVAFGDIFLEDLKHYRERQVEKASLKGVFPIWGTGTRELMEEFLRLGYKTVVVALDSSRLPQEFIGREINMDFLQALPDDVDPCGENGEFHTFVIDGPLFKNPLTPEFGDVVERHYPSPADKNKLITYYFQDLLPG